MLEEREENKSGGFQALSDLPMNAADHRFAPASQTKSLPSLRLTES